MRSKPRNQKAVLIPTIQSMRVTCNCFTRLGPLLPFEHTHHAASAPSPMLPLLSNLSLSQCVRATPACTNQP